MNICASGTTPVTIQLLSLPTPPPPQPPPFRPSTTNSIPPSINHTTFTNSQSKNSSCPLEATTASWTSSIAQHCKNGRLTKAVMQFTRMRSSGIEPNDITFVTILSGCAHFPSQGLSIGPSIHGYARKLGLDVNNVKVGTAVIDMYSRFGKMGLARLAFDRMVIKNKVSWNTIINGYMRSHEFETAIKLFDEMPDRDAVSWTVLIDGFVKKGSFEEALGWFQEMQLSGIEPDFVTMVSMLSAVANLGAFSLGLWLHRFVLMNHLSDNIRVNNSLIDMYCRCGCVELACQVFENMPNRSLVSWNSIIVGLAMNAHAKEAFKYFDAMQIDGFKPDGVSFTGALTACSHAGLVNEGLRLFQSMNKFYKITPTIEHYGCIVDLYCRARRLKEAFLVLKNMPMKPNEVVVGSLLAACRTCDDVELAERLMSYIHDLDPGGDFNYVMLSNIYAAQGSWRGASNVRKKMKVLGIQKRPGISSIEVNGTFHDFMAGDRSHDHTESIYSIMEHLSHELRTSANALEVKFRELYEYY